MSGQSKGLRKLESRAYQSPKRHVGDPSATTTNGESENKNHDLSSPVECGRQQEVVLAEPYRAISAEIILRKYGK